MKINIVRESDGSLSLVSGETKLVFDISVRPEAEAIRAKIIEAHVASVAIRVACGCKFGGN